MYLNNEYNYFKTLFLIIIKNCSTFKLLYIIYIIYKLKLLQLNYFNLYKSTTNFQTMLKIKILIASIVYYLYLVKNIRI